MEWLAAIIGAVFGNVVGRLHERKRLRQQAARLAKGCERFEAAMAKYAKQ